MSDLSNMFVPTGKPKRPDRLHPLLPVIFALVVVAAWSLAFKAEAATDDRPFCLMALQGTKVAEEYPGQTRELCGVILEEKTWFQRFNSFVWAITPL